MKKHLAWFIVVAFAALVPIWAQTADEINDGSNNAGTDTDKKLNAAYRQLIRKIQTEDKQRSAIVIAQLRETQRAWLKFLDAQVQFVGLYNNIGSASARNAGMSSYRAELTEERIKDIVDVPNPF
jgi:uncharacterized protein YecT (DUF1311 family)